MELKTGKQDSREQKQRSEKEAQGSLGKRGPAQAHGACLGEAKETDF